MRKLLYTKGHNYQKEETTHRMAEILLKVFIKKKKELISRIYKDTKH
jgi:hypothetical protein